MQGEREIIGSCSPAPQVPDSQTCGILLCVMVMVSWAGVSSGLDPSASFGSHEAQSHGKPDLISPSVTNLCGIWCTPHGMDNQTFPGVSLQSLSH